MSGALDLATVSLDEEARELVIIDQTALPQATRLLRLHTAEDIYDAIARLAVRGAPAIGVAAAIGLYVCACRFEERQADAFFRRLAETKAYLASSRPTAVNLTWALDRMERAACEAAGTDIPAVLERLRQEACAIRDEDIAVCRKIGEYGLTLLHDGDGILTHCNAGQLAAVHYGTALAPIHLGAERGMRFHVFTDETRPLLQGARLSAYELQAAGVETTLLCDNMAASVMKNGWVQAVLVGCDRVARNGDAANKIGTSGVAILAHHYGIPFYVAAPSSTIDFSCPDGDAIPIEQRAPEEVTDLWYARRMAPPGVGVYNPAFDVTEHTLITAIITEYGIARPPYAESLRALCGAR